MKRAAALVLLLSASLISFAPPAQASNHRICLAYDTGGPGDRSFNDAAAAGIKQAEKKLEFALATTVTSGEAKDRLDRVRALIAKDCAIVIAVGTGYAATLTELSVEYADQQFAILNDATVESFNVSALTFADVQGAYLAGFAAALSSKSGKIGMIGYSSQSAIYRDGFVAGAKSANKNIKTQVRYVSESASTDASALLRAGIDSIFLATTGSAEEVFGVIVKANKTTRVKNPASLITIEPDQFLSVDAQSKKFVVATVVKRVDLALIDLIKVIISGSSLYDVVDPILGIYGRNYGISEKAIEITLRSPLLQAASKSVNLAGNRAAALSTK